MNSCSGCEVLNSKINRIEHMIRLNAISAASEVDAIEYIRSQLSPHGYIPAAGGWAASYRTLAFIVGEILDSPTPTTIIEFGSGVSTAWIALALKEYGDGKLISIEHDAKFLHATSKLLARNDLSEHVDLRHAPLKEINESVWYDPVVVTRDLPTLDLAFVDGPPGTGTPLSRKPAFDVLKHYLRDGALVLLDDCDRPDEQEIIALWTENSSGDCELLLEGEVSRTALMRYVRTAGIPE